MFFAFYEYIQTGYDDQRQLLDPEDLEEQRFNLGIFGSGNCGMQDSEWIGMYPEVSWRSIDCAGCLHPA